ncbi:MAG TPA: PINc/VapC family ATPase [Candidatus Thermoplasmatota archaeon]|jgi:ATPase|nr:PINc/VapC family ATPase [Candidatus Thermoplasmatota archaeon]
MSPPKPAPKDARAIFVPDTSVIVDGRITMMVQRGELGKARVLIHEAVIAELEYQANQGRDTGYTGLNEIVKLQQLKEAAELSVEFVGQRPGLEHIQLAGGGEIDAMIRRAAQDHQGTLVTSDSVQSHVARSLGIPVIYIKPVHEPKEAQKEIHELEIWKFFDDRTMSVHLKFNCAPVAKKGTPGSLRLVKLDDSVLDEKRLNRIAREIMEAARRDAHSFVEIERHGATVVQLGPVRIAIARPPFSDGMEITAVRPVARLTLDQYNLPEELRQRLREHTRGTFISGPPGSGKSTFAQAIADYLQALGVIVKTMESPRDLQVPDEVTQYAPLEGSMELTSDILLLVRPDFVIYDEVRKTEDFRIFADMRLAGVGLVGVTHANRAIDAVQRLIGRVELGMIPQVVDTIIHIEKGAIKEVMELVFTVKVPAGMMEADLARPVIEMRDFYTRKSLYEIYTYGEQVVVMPVAKAGGTTARSRLAEGALLTQLRRHVEGDVQVEMTGEDQATVFVEEWEVPRLIGKAGRNVQRIESELGVRIDVQPLKQRIAKGQRTVEGAKKYAELTPEVRKTKQNIVLILEPEFAGQNVDVCIDGEQLFTATVGRKGEVKISRDTDLGQDVLDGIAAGRRVTCRM